MKPIFIIEHLESKLWPWCLIEYESISNIVGKRAWFCNIKSEKDARKLSSYGRAISQSLKGLNINMKYACVLDPLAKKTLSMKEASRFQYFIFGGILGDQALNGRTKRELTRFLKKAQSRNLGPGQFSTDNAVYVVREIVKGKELKDIKFKDGIEIKINKIESVILPYRYPIINGKPKISAKLVKYLKNKKGF